MELINIKQGEIYLTDLNPVIGSETGKIRPALIISNDINNTYADTVTILPVTSTLGKIYPFEVKIKAGHGGLSKESKVKTNQIRTVDKRRIIKRLGSLEKITMKQVEKALLIHLDIEN